MSGDITRMARESAERCIPAVVPEREVVVAYYVAGYMAGRAAHIRWANKTIDEYRRAVSASGDGK